MNFAGSIDFIDTELLCCIGKLASKLPVVLYSIVAISDASSISRCSEDTIYDLLLVEETARSIWIKFCLKIGIKCSNVLKILIVAFIVCFEQNKGIRVYNMAVTSPIVNNVKKIKKMIMDDHWGGWWYWHVNIYVTYISAFKEIVNFKYN